jgi:hypothetical protein
VTTYIKIFKSIKVTPQIGDGGRRKSDDVLKFQLLEALFQNWTFINVHFSKPEVEI